MRILLICSQDSSFQKLLEKRCLLFSLTIRDNPIPMIFVWKRKERQVYLKLNSNRIYILTSQSTASSSEVVINSLNPFMDVILIGELTEGKNVGMEMQKNDKYEWIYWPITLRVTNAVNDDYSAGFKPDIEWNEYDLTQNPTDALLPLGDPDEFMLGKAISLITGINRSARSMNTLSQPIMRGESVYQSTERHATGGMLMVPEEKNN